MNAKRMRGGFWIKGQPLTENDKMLLQPLITKAKELGYTPTVADISTACLIKNRFRIWEDAIYAAGLPSLKDPVQMNLRKEAKTKKLT
jgi:hypothetical protein